MTEISDETRFMENRTVADVAAVCRQIIPDMDIEVRANMSDASVIVRHEPGRGPTIAQADRIAEVLRRGRPLHHDRADWHAGGFGPYSDAVEPSIVYGTEFGLVRSFLPAQEALDRNRV